MWFVVGKFTFVNIKLAKKKIHVLEKQALLLVESDSLCPNIIPVKVIGYILQDILINKLTDIFQYEIDKINI